MISAAEALTFTAPGHEYRLNGRRLLSVTQILTIVGAIEDDWYTDEATRRGQWVHEATALLDRDELDTDAAARTQPAWWPYVAAYARFLTECTPEICDVECRVHDATYGYAGTLDRTCFLGGRWTLIDLKTGAPARWHALQTAAYARLRLHDHRRPDRYALYLKADGTYRLSDPFTNRHDERAFLAAVYWAAWQSGDRHDA